MALGTIAPWLQLPDFIGAAHAGASIGLQQRKAADDVAMERAKLEQSAIEASGRLSLGYTEAENAARRAQAEHELAQASMALHQGRYSDLSKQAEERHQLGLDRLTALEDNRDTVNGLHQDQLDSLNDHRDAVDALRGTRATGGGSRAAGSPAEKPFMVKVELPDGTSIPLPSTDPRAQEYLNKKFETPIDTNRPIESAVPKELFGGLINLPAKNDLPDAVYPGGGQGGETLPLPGSEESAAQALKPRNLIYEGDKAGAPPSDQLPSNIYMGSATQPAIADPGTMPAETLAQPSAKVLDKATASTLLKQAKGDKEVARRLARESGYQF